MVAFLLALGLMQGPIAYPDPLDRFDELADALEPAASVVVLECQVSAKALKDCKVVGEAAQDGAAVAEALRMASQIVVPDGMTGSAPGHSIRVKLNITP
jgi:hypothetical protein